MSLIGNFQQQGAGTAGGIINHCEGRGFRLANANDLRNYTADFRRGVKLALTLAAASGRLSSSANQTGFFLPSGPVSYSENDVNGTTQRFGGPSHRRQCGDAVLRSH